MAHVYKLVGKAGRQSPDYVPSLIGIGYKQEAPTPDDAYFEQYECEEFRSTGERIDLRLSQWIVFDELSQGGRDPILEVRAGTLAFYCPVSDLRTIADEEGWVNLNEAIDKLVSGRVR